MQLKAYTVTHSLLTELYVMHGCVVILATSGPTDETTETVELVSTF